MYPNQQPYAAPGGSPNLNKFTNGQRFGLPNGIRLAIAELSWDGTLDVDLFVATPAGMVFFNQRMSPDGAIQLSSDAQTGNSLNKTDESATIDLTRLAPHINEVAIGAGVQGMGMLLGHVSNAMLTVKDGTTGMPIGAVDLDATFGNVPAGKLGEFKRMPDGGWQFFVELRPFRTLDELSSGILYS